MIEVSQKLHLTESPQAEHRVIEWSDLLDCDFLSRGFMERRAVNRLAAIILVVLLSQTIGIIYLPNDSIGTFTNNILNIVLLAHIEGNLSRTLRRVRLTRHRARGMAVCSRIDFRGRVCCQVVFECGKECGGRV